MVISSDAVPSLVDDLAALAMVGPTTMAASFAILAVLSLLNVAITKLATGRSILLLTIGRAVTTAAVERSDTKDGAVVVRRLNLPYSRRTFVAAWRQSSWTTLRVLAAFSFRTLGAVALAGSIGVLAAGHLVFPTGGIAQLTHAIVEDSTSAADVLADLVPSAGLIPLAATLNVILVAHLVRFQAGRSHPRVGSGSPHLRFADAEVPLVRRHWFLTRFSLYRQLHGARVVALAAGIFAIVRVWPDIDSSSDTGLWSERDWYGVVLVASLAFMFGMFLMIRNLVDHALPSLRAAWAVQQCLDPPPDPTRVRPPAVADPLGSQRRRLVDAAVAVRRAGSRMDLTNRQHPVATVLLGCAAYLQSFLMQTRSLTSRYPDDVSEVLSASITLLAGPRDPAFVITVAKRVNAFDGDGSPQAALRRRHAGWWSGFFGRVIEAVEPYARLGNAAWAIFTVVAVGVLLVSGALDITTFQLQK